VVESFSPWPELYKKIFLNPLGVDIDLFPLMEGRKAGIPTAIFVGQWSFRKGVDVLVKAVKLVPDARLVHVGAIADVSFPEDKQFVHHDHVPQQQLAKFYQQAHVLVLPSREDGFGVVLSQALASGLTVVCTDKTGGPDLAALPGLSRLIHIVPSDDYGALADALSKSLENAFSTNAVAPISDDERQMLGWRCYAQRDLDFMSEVVSRAKEDAVRLAAE
jgi:glycosyltransferase involved in cell wall biosynthesis